MGRKRKGELKEKKRKRVSITPIEREHAGKITAPYKVMEGLVNKHHSHLVEAGARIAMAWDEGPVKEDADGYVKFGRVKRGADLDRAYAPFDFWLIIRRELWQSWASDATRQAAEIDRLLCRCMVVRDKHGEILVDEKDRPVFRLRKPVEVFPENVARFGFHQEPKLTDCLGRFNDSKRPLLAGQDTESSKKRRGSRFSEPAKQTDPAKDEANGHVNGSTNGLMVGLDTIGVPNVIIRALEAVQLTTLADVIEYEREHGEAGFAELDNMGPSRAELLRELIGQYRNEHPELAEAS